MVRTLIGCNIDSGVSGLFREGTFDGTPPHANKHWVFTTIGDTIQEGDFIVVDKVAATYRRTRMYENSKWGEWKLVKRI